MPLHVQGSMISCGVQQLFGVETVVGPRDLRAIERLLYITEEPACQCESCKLVASRVVVGPNYHKRRMAFLVFSDRDFSSGHRTLVQIIRDLKLGTVIATEKALNPNSGNCIIVYVWKIPEWDVWSKALLVPCDKGLAAKVSKNAMGNL